MTKEERRWAITKLRNEISRCYGDQMIGGPDHKLEIEGYQRQIRELEAQPTDD